MSLADQIVTEARSWTNTAFRHQGRLRGVGVDCVGFVSEVAKAVGINVEIPNDYRPHDDGLVMLSLLENYMELVDEAQPGDVLALISESLTSPEIPRHLAFVTEVLPHTTKIIHASQKGVREHRMDSFWWRRVHSIWRLSGA